MTVDWDAVHRQHHADGSGRCSCGKPDCGRGLTARQMIRDQEDALLPGKAATAPFISVFEGACPAAPIAL